MATFHNIEDYRKHLKGKMSAARKAGIKSCSQAASYMVLTAKSLAPRSSGETIEGIRKRPKKEGYVVTSTVTGSFKHNLFANQTAPYRTIRFGERGGASAYAPNQTVVYGGPAISRSGKQINWTAKPRFFHMATLRTRQYFKRVSVQNNRLALRTGFGEV